MNGPHFVTRAWGPGDVPFDSVIPVLAIIMGFRPTFDSLHLNETLRPLGWERVRTPADILTLSRPSMSPTIVTLVDPLIAPPTDSSIETWMEARMRCDLPEDPETTGAARPYPHHSSPPSPINTCRGFAIMYFLFPFDFTPIHPLDPDLARLAM